MGIVNPTLGTIGGPRGDGEAAERNALATLLAEFNGNIDSNNIKDASIALGDLVAAVQQALVPTTTMHFMARSAAPTGYLLCDGSAVSRTDYPALFSALNADGLKYGAGDGSTTFNVPDMRGRVPVGKGTNAAVDNLGDADALALSSRTPVHNHNFSGTTTEATVASLDAPGFAGVASGQRGHTHGYSGTTTVSGPAFLTGNWFIKT